MIEKKVLDVEKERIEDKKVIKKYFEGREVYRRWKNGMKKIIKKEMEGKK